MHPELARAHPDAVRNLLPQRFPFPPMAIPGLASDQKLPGEHKDIHQRSEKEEKPKIVHKQKETEQHHRQDIRVPHPEAEIKRLQETMPPPPHAMRIPNQMMPHPYQNVRHLPPHMLSPHERFTDSPAMAAMHGFPHGRPMPSHLPMQLSRSHEDHNKNLDSPHHNERSVDEREKSAIPAHMKQAFPPQQSSPHNEPLSLSSRQFIHPIIRII